MKLIAISDTHQLHKNIVVPDGDILVHCGDWTNKGATDQIEDFLIWFSGQPHKYKVFIAGNHELGLDQGPMRIRKLAIIHKYINHFPNMFYLENRLETIAGIKFYGSPVTPEFFNWAWNVKRGSNIAKFWAAIPNDTNVLITHGPPYGTLDLVQDTVANFGRDLHQGCEDLAKRVRQLPDLKAHVFGHLHTCGSQQTEINGVKFVNAAICTENYKPTNLPVIIEI